MSGMVSLNGTWGLTYVEGVPLVASDYYTATAFRGRRLLPAAVPAPVHKVLLDAGLLEDPRIGMNSLKARWVEEAYWIYRHTFRVPAEAMEQRAWLAFDRLEYDATVWLNGQEIGCHANAHRPARFDVTGRLRPADNLLVVQVTTGMQQSADRPSGEYGARDMERMTKRLFHRKPQYQTGWDWNPRLTNVGILGDVRVEWRSGPRLAQVAVFAVPRDDLSSATVHVRTVIEGTRNEPEEGVLRAKIVETGREASMPVCIAPGEARYDLTIPIEQPRLWWPVGQGEPFRYTVECSLEVSGDRQAVMRKTGVRRVEMDQSPHPEGGRYCTLRINNRPVFCKGGNWVPADLLYSTVDAARYRELVDLAVRANFNMLRIWGGGLFADHALCEACDEAGVLIWHDFLFACAKYPGDDPVFVDEVRRETTWAVRELAHHPSLVVWCGNNEIEWFDANEGFGTTYRARPHYALFHRDIPRIVREEDASTLFWLSSPWSPDLQYPNDPTCGDQHPWGVSILTPGPADWWQYREYVDRFPNEGGVLGASSPATLRQFLPENERFLFSPSWEHHDNPFACTAQERGELGRAYATVELWTGRDPLKMPLEEYAFVSALMQAEGLQEYILNYRRRMFSSASAVFWMYNDSWPVSHGWTIVDYYRRRKLSYHPVRRAFQPVTVVVTCDESDVAVFGVNETSKPWSGELRCGLFALAGGLPRDQRLAVTLPPGAATLAARFPRSEWDALDRKRSGAFATLSQGGRTVAQHRLFVERFKDLAFVEPRIEMSSSRGELTLRADAFVWAVCLDVDGESTIADNCFDLLPGIAYTMPWNADLGQPRIVRIGSRDAVRPV